MVRVFLGDLSSVTSTVGPVANQPGTPPPPDPIPGVWSLITSPQLWAANTGNGQPPRPGVFGTAAAYTGQIAPSATTGAPIDLTPFMDILENGIRNQADLEKANQLFMLIDPEDAGKISEATKHVEIKFVQKRQGQASSDGSTHITFDQSVDRKNAGEAKHITLTVFFEGKGANLFTLLHERVHAAAYANLPSDYQLDLPTIPIPDPYKEGVPLRTIFQAVLANKYYDEAMAFSSEVRLAKAFEHRTGRSLLDFGSFQADRHMITHHRAHYDRHGFEGVYWAITQSKGYLPYKLGALYLSLVIKSGAKDYPNWGELLTMMGAEEKGGSVTLSQNAQQQFYETYLKKLLEKYGARLAIAAIGLTAMQGEAAASRDRTLAFLQGKLSAAETADFLEKDFDFVVTQIGAMLGDPIEEEVRARKPKQSTDTTTDLPPRPIPLPTGDPQLIGDHPEVAADMVEILGKEAEFIYKFKEMNDEEIVRRWNTFLNYAERCDPETAGHIYGILIGLTQKTPYPERQWLLGISLLRSGYQTEGLQQINNSLSEGLYLAAADMHYTWKANRLPVPKQGELQLLLEKGGEPLVEQIIALIETEVGNFETTQKITLRLPEVLNNLGDLAKAIDTLPPSHPLQLRMTALAQRIQILFEECLKGNIENNLTKVADYELPEKIAKDKAGNFGSAFDKFLTFQLQTSFLYRLGLKTILLRVSHGDYRETSAYLMAQLNHASLDPANFPQDQHTENLESRFFVALHNVPKDFSDSERRELWDLYFRTFPQVHYHHLKDLVSLALRGQDPQLRGLGVNLLSTPQTDPLVEFRRSKTLLKNLDQFPAPERPIVLERLYAQLSQLSTQSHQTLHQMETLLELVKQSLRIGHLPLIHHIISDWPNRSAQWKTTIDASNQKANSQYQQLGHQIELILNATGALLSSGEEFDALIGQIEADLTRGRNQFAKTALIELLRLLNGTALAQGRETGYVRLARATIQKTVEGLGSDSDLIKYELAPLVETLMEAPLSDHQKDLLFSFLIEKATPQEGVFATSSKGLESLLEVIKLIPALLETNRFPQARALFLNRVVTLARKIKFNTQDHRVMAAFKGLQWVCEKISSKIILDPANRARLEALRTGKDYTEALNFLHSFLAPPQTKLLTLAEAKAQYRDALRQQDMARLAELAPTLRKILETELNTLTSTSKPEAVLKFWIYEIYRDWQQALSLGHEELANALFEIWAPSEDPDYLQKKELLFFKELACPELSLTWKRKIFSLLQQTKLISTYAIRSLETFQQQNDPLRENMLYRALGESTKGKNGINNYWLACLVHLPIDQAEEFLKRLQRMQTLEADPAQGWKPDLSNPHDWRLYIAEGFHTSNNIQEQRLTYLFVALSLIVKMEAGEFSEGAWNYGSPEKDKFITAFNTLKASLTEKQRAQIAYDVDVEDIFALLHDRTLPRGEEARRLLNTLTQIQKEHAILSEHVRLAQIRLPDFFRGHGELTERLLTWLYLELPIGEQNELLKALDKTNNFGEALRIFIEKTGLEKVGQFLSFWPEVPEAIRRELSHLQSNVPPSDITEVKDKIREQLAGNPHLEELLANLQEKPLGSGTIGETYRSAITVNGVRQEVVVKVIPKSKEDKFTTALDRVEKVGRLLELFADELPGAGRAHRLMVMFSAMVRRELDLREEAKNMDAVREGREASIDIPQVIVGEDGKVLVSAKVMVQEFVQGVPLTEIADLKQRREMLEAVQTELMRQALELGAYHSDLQPGNVLVEAKDDGTYKIWLFDFGQMGRLKPEERDQVQDFIVQIAGKDPVEIIRVLQLMGKVTERFDFNGLQADVSRIVGEWNGDPNNIAAMVNQLFEACSNRGLNLRKPFLQLLKALVTYEAMARAALEAPAATSTTPKPEIPKPEIPKPTSPPKPDSPWLTALKGFWKEHVTTYGERALAEKARIVEALNQHFAGELKPEEINQLFDRLYDPMAKTFTARSSSGEVFENLNQVEALLQMAVEQGKGNTVTIEDFLVQIEGRKDGTLGRFQEASFKEILKSPIWVERPMGGATTFIIADILSEAAMGRWQHASMLHAGLTWAELAAVGGGSKKILEAGFEALEAKLKASLTIDQYKNVVGNKRYLTAKRGLINHAGTYLALAFMQMIATGEVSLTQLGKTGVLFMASHTVTAAVMKGLSLVLKGLKGTGIGTVVSTVVDFYVFKKIEAIVSSIMLDWDMSESIEDMEASVAKIRVNQDGEVDYEAFNKAFNDLVALKVQDNEAALVLQKYQVRLDEIHHHNIFLLHRLMHQPEVIRGQSELVAKKRILDPKLFRTHAYAIAHNRLTELPSELRDYVLAARTQASKLMVAAIENDAALKSLETEFLEHCGEVDPMTAIALREQLTALKTQAKTQALTKSWGLADQNIAGLLTQAALLANQKTAESERQTFMAEYKQRYTDWDKKDLLIKTLWNSYPNDPYYGFHQQEGNLQLSAPTLEVANRELDLDWWKGLSLPDLYVLKDYVNEFKATPQPMAGFEALIKGIQSLATP